jgi:hypothetical protein
MGPQQRIDGIIVDPPSIDQIIHQPFGRAGMIKLLGRNI